MPTSRGDGPLAAPADGRLAAPADGRLAAPADGRLAAWQAGAAEDRVVRPAAIIAAHAFAEVTAALESMDVGRGGVWSAGVGLWQRFAAPWTGGQSTPLIGSIGVSYDTPSRHMATIFRVAVTQAGRDAGYTAEKLADEALMACGLALAQLPRAELGSAPANDPFYRRRLGENT